ncbi:Dph6-related ATP pyrophosphatase [Myroides sp. LJL119]
MTSPIKKVVLHWSSGKDAAYTLYELNKSEVYQVVKLFTTLNSQTNRVSMHGVSYQVLKRQAKATGLELEVMFFCSDSSMDSYEQGILEKLKCFKSQAIDYNAYGDILLEDLKHYRVSLLQRQASKGLFVLWHRNTRELLLQMIDSGLKTIVVCVNDRYLDKSFLGRIIDRKFLEDLPPNVDPCGENGEYHSFAFDGPMFKYRVDFKIGESVYKSYEIRDSQGNIQKSGFWFLELL